MLSWTHPRDDLFVPFVDLRGAAMNCPACKSNQVGQIAFASIGEGVKFSYCRQCESKWWVDGENRLELKSVLKQATFSKAT